MSLISTCRREKYFAKTRTSTSFIISTGWKEKNPKSNQLLSSPKILPRVTSAKRAKDISKKRKTRTSVRFRKRKSIKEKIKKTAKDMKTQIICLLKKSPPLSSVAKDFIVTNPAKIIGII